MNNNINAESQDKNGRSPECLSTVVGDDLNLLDFCFLEIADLLRCRKRVVFPVYTERLRMEYVPEEETRAAFAPTCERQRV